MPIDKLNANRVSFGEEKNSKCTIHMTQIGRYNLLFLIISSIFTSITPSRSFRWNSDLKISTKIEDHPKNIEIAENCHGFECQGNFLGILLHLPIFYVHDMGSRPLL
jgi:hypothetical protein